MYFGGQPSCSARLLEGQLGQLDLAVLALDLRLLSRELAGLGFELFVGPLQLILLLPEQFLGRLERRGLLLEPGVGLAQLVLLVP